MEVLINGVKFIETDELYPIKDGVYYQNKWYKPIDYKINEWIIYLKALKESIDFDKLRDSLPKLYYPNNQFELVIKEDLIEWFDARQ